MQLLLANSLSIVCVICAGYILVTGHDGWGWFLFIALLGLHTLKPKEKK